MIIKYFHDSNWTNDVASFLTKFVKRNKKKNLRLILTGGNSSKLINKQIIENLNTDCRLNIYLSDERCTKFANKDSLNQTFFKRLNLNKCLKGNLNIYGHSFSEKDLVLGNLYLYYIQFVSNYLFGHPEAYEPFKNDDIIKKAISNAIENIGDIFYDKDKLNKFLKNNFFINDELIFKHLDIIEFEINLPRFPIFFGSKQIIIPKTNWIIKVLIRKY